MTAPVPSFPRASVPEIRAAAAGFAATAAITCAAEDIPATMVGQLIGPVTIVHAESPSGVVAGLLTRAK